MGNRTRMHIPICEARIRHRLRPSSPSPAFLRFIRLAAPFYTRIALHITDIRLRNPETLVNAWKDFQEKRVRLILAFRHPYGDEPQLISIVCDTLLSKAARALGVSFPEKPHARLLHGYEVALWGNAVIRAVLPLSGAMPVYHRKTDASGMKLIRSVLKDGPHPVALAPEGQVSYRSETVPRLEPGTMRMAFWCARDLKQERRSERTLVLPISIHYRFDPRDTGKFLNLMRQLERRCGLAPTMQSVVAESPESSAFRKGMRDRLIRIETSLLRLAEEHYGALCGYMPPEPHTTADLAASPETRRQHWNNVMLSALETGERILGIWTRAQGGMLSHAEAGLEGRIDVSPKSQDAPDSLSSLTFLTSLTSLNSLIDRVYRIRHEGWERIYPVEEVGAPGTVRSAMAHRRAGEAWYAMRHMEFVDLTAYLDPAYLDSEHDPDGPSFDRLVEAGLNLYDLSCRLSGGNITNRNNTLRRKAIILTGNPIDVTARLPEKDTDWKKAAAEATLELGEAFRQCIHTYRESG